jgi:hypothetical protein
VYDFLKFSNISDFLRVLSKVNMNKTHNKKQIEQYAHQNNTD